MFVLPGAHVSPHHAAAGSDATVSPVVPVPVPAVPEPQQPPRSVPLSRELSKFDYLGTGEAVSIDEMFRSDAVNPFFCLHQHQAG